MRHKLLRPFMGVNNRLPDTQLSVEGGGNRLKDARNVDITNAGTLRRRQGYTPIISAIHARSLWADGDEAFYVDNQSLCRLTGDPLQPKKEVLRTDLRPNLSMSFARMDKAVFYSNGADIGKVDNGEDVPLWPRPFAWTPEARGESGGALGAGLYQIIATRIDADGRESPPTPAVQASVPENGKLVVRLVEAATLYLTPQNGDEFFSVGSLDAGEHEISVATDGGGRCFTRDLALMPPGQIVRVHKGRLFVASGNTLIFSEPWSPGLYDPVSSSMTFAEKITLLEPCGEGMFIAAEKTWWLAGDVAADAQLVVVQPFGAYPGSGRSLPDGNAVVWYSSMGVVMGSASGETTLLQAEDVAVRPGSEAAILHRRQGGLRQLVVGARDPGMTVAGARTMMDAEILQRR